MRLVACTSCHAQYDVTDVGQKQFRCRCGTTVENRGQTAVDAQIKRCSSCGAALTSDQASCGFCGSPITRDPGKLSLICPECLARNADDAKFCTHCGVEFQPQSVFDIGAERICPCCDEAMVERGIGGVHLHECPHCNGLWVPGESFDELVNRTADAQRTQPTAGLGVVGADRQTRTVFSQKVEYRRCPVCESPMHRKNFGRRSGVVVDWCRSHGTWLDADELEAIAAFILDGGLQGGRGTTGHGLGGAATPALSADQLETLLVAERQLSEQSDGRQRQLTWRHAGRHTWKQTLGDLFEALLGD